MSLDYNFDIIEQPDAKSFIFKDLTGLYNAVTNLGGWGLPNNELEPLNDSYDITVNIKKYLNIATDETSEEWEYNLNTLKYSITALITDGVELYAYPEESLFEDNAYKVTVTIKLNSTSELITSVIKDFGFYATTKSNCINQFITYNQFLPKRDKEIFLEKMRLLDNLYFACETDQIIHFKENLDMLTRLK